MLTRRGEIRRLAAIAALLAVAPAALSAGAPYAKFRELPVTAIQPEGWLRDWLLKQRNGLTGHLDQTWQPFTSPSWNTLTAARWEGEGWWPYEQNAFWIEGMLRCGYLLGDPFLIRKARTFTDFVLDHPGENGYLGPRQIRIMRWPHALLFQSLALEYSAGQEARIPRALERHYLNDSAPFDYDRNVANVEALCWTYDVTHNERLLALAIKAWEQVSETGFKGHFSLTSLLSHDLPIDHGPTWVELIKIPVILYLNTGEERWLRAATNGFRKLERDQMLVDGAPSSDEYFDGNHPRAVHETCTIVDQNLSLAYLLYATGSAEWADKLERATFNAAAGAVLKNFKALQYFSGPNQVLATRNSSTGTGPGDRMSYRPAHDTQCCVGSVNRIFPGYASRMWLEEAKGVLVAAMYGPSSVRFHPAGVDFPVRVVETTEYPFSDRIGFRVETPHPAKFTLLLRIPGWTKAPSLTLNDRPVQVTLEPGTFARLERTFSPGDRLVLILPMQLKMTRWPENGAAVERGPLVYSLKIEEEHKVVEDAPGASREFPAWDMLPTSDWNYALAVSEKSLQKDVKLWHRVSDDPWKFPPVYLRAPAKLLDGWMLERGINPRNKERGIFTPRLPQPRDLDNVPVEMITLVPYGCTQLRLTVFPDWMR